MPDRKEKVGTTETVSSRATREIGAHRRDLAPEIHRASDEVRAAAEMRAGGAFAHSTVPLHTLDTISH